MTMHFKDVAIGDTVVMQCGIQITKTSTDGAVYKDKPNSGLSGIHPNMEVCTIDEFWDNSEPVTDLFDI